ncbi:signal peptidase I SipW [Aquibacillus rhizosphaerae]|uniref:Signal peptidase I n=1 Tax=Aquibacillus rhizosphaerae TaxID=3051431 RepID=A0ABT7L0S0_9BACI|nr:signal peptidase I [Aquibacillus sp. LR5S19]MDL4838939.1 signal peptidase I [Aquibacillus sp. LR5S19]
MKLKKIRKWASHFITFTLFVTLICMVFIVISSKASGGEPEVLGYQLKTVLSGSMEPGVKTGSIIAVKPGGDMTRFEKDDVITFIDEEEKLVTHRVVDVTNSGDHIMYQTKGDNNNTPDVNPVLADNVVAEYTGFTIPYAGYVVNFAQSKQGSALLLILPGVLLLLYAGFTIWRAISQIDEKDGAKEPLDEKLSSTKSNG